MLKLSNNRKGAYGYVRIIRQRTNEDRQLFNGLPSRQYRIREQGILVFNKSNNLSNTDSLLTKVQKLEDTSSEVVDFPATKIDFRTYKIDEIAFILLTNTCE